MDTITPPAALSQLELITPENEARILYARQDHTLNLFALALLQAACGDRAKAEALFDDIVDLMVEDGALSTWRYRLVLAKIRGQA
jgi:hypothetical protein